MRRTVCSENLTHLFVHHGESENEKGLWIVWCCSVLLALPVMAACPSADRTGDCRVDLADFAVIAEQWLTAYDSDDLAAMTSEWLTEGFLDPDITWVLITDADFIGQMSKYETTNAQYCVFLNAALASGDVTVCGNYVCGADGSNSGSDFVGQAYYSLIGNGMYYTVSHPRRSDQNPLPPTARLPWTADLKPPRHLCELGWFNGILQLLRLAAADRMGVAGWPIMTAATPMGVARDHEPLANYYNSVRGWHDGGWFVWGFWLWDERHGRQCL
jgi:hypothetical protein